MRSRLLRLASGAARRLPLGMRLSLYRLGPITRLIRSTLTRAAPAGVGPVTVAAGDLAGMTLWLDLQVDKDLWLGTYEPEVSAAIRRFARPGAVAYDLGANVGYTTLLLARAVAPGGRVFAFEPLETNLERLRRAVARNGLEAVVSVVPCAVGARRGREMFLVHASGGMGRLESATGRREKFEASIAVEAVTLDDFVFGQGHPAPSVVKIDLEGGEVESLQGARRLLRETRPVLLVELHGPSAAAEVVRLLGSAGYGVHVMSRGYPMLEPDRAGRAPKHIVGIAGGHAA